jgi:pyruvate dehydrogenase E2 component (dihydrolipoamide acetyltransferase)
VVADRLLAFREQINDDPGAHDRDDTAAWVSATDLPVKACAQPLTAHPRGQLLLGAYRLLRHRRVHVGVAGALDDSLIVS